MNLIRIGLHIILKISFQFQKIKNKRENYFSKYFERNIIYMGQSVFKFKKLKTKRENYFCKYFEWNRIYMGQPVFKFKKLKNKGVKCFRNEFNRNRITHYSKSVFNFKTLKTRERIVLANTLNGIEFTWASLFSS